MTDSTYSVPPEVGEAAEVAGPGVVDRGSLWQVQWDGTSRYAVVSSDFNTFVLAMPVSFDPSAAVDEAVIVRSAVNNFGVDIVLWPQLETGLGLHLLRARLGSFLDEDFLDDIQESVLEGSDDRATADESADRAVRDSLARDFTNLCFADWTGGMGARIDRDAFESVGGSFEILERALDGDFNTAMQVIRGRRFLSAEAVLALSRALNVAADKFSGDVSVPEEMNRALSDPRQKDVILGVGEKLNISEIEVRQKIAGNLLVGAFRQSQVKISWAARVNSYIDEIRAEPARLLGVD